MGRGRQRKQCAQGRPPTAEVVLARAGAERTANMASMVVTLDVSKLSGWLNAAAACRVKRRVYNAERGVGRGREGVRRRLRASGMHGERARL